MPESYKQRIEAARPQLFKIALETYGLEMNPGPSGQNTRIAMIGAKFAEAAGKGEAYHARVMQHYWRDAGRVDDLDQLKTIVADIGLDVAAFETALSAVEYDDAVTADVEQAAAFGLSGVPAIVLNEKYLLSGAQPYDTLVRAVEKIATS